MVSIPELEVLCNSTPPVLGFYSTHHDLQYPPPAGLCFGSKNQPTQTQQRCASWVPALQTSISTLQAHNGPPNTPGSKIKNEQRQK